MVIRFKISWRSDLPNSGEFGYEILTRSVSEGSATIVVTSCQILANSATKREAAKFWRIRLREFGYEKRRTLMDRLKLLALAVALLVRPIYAAPPSDPVLRKAIVGSPTGLTVTPASVTLSGDRSSQQLLVTGQYADGSMRDLTPFCEWVVSDPERMAISTHGLISGQHDGKGDIEIRVGGKVVVVQVTVSDAGKTEPIRFRRDVVPTLSVAGCSDIRCHGAPSGKAGFRLSLWGSDPALDFQQLARDAFGRRTNAFAPDDSLILLKATAQISHVGGKRFEHDSRLADVLRNWQQEGLRDETQPASLASLVVVPSQRVLHAPARWQQLAVHATFDGGRREDVTALTTFSTTDLAIANVDREGLVEFKGQGEVAILCRYLGNMATVRLMHIAEPAADYAWSQPPENNYIDRHAFAKMKMLHINPSELCSDDQFIRRAYLDICGILPTPGETRAFVASTDPTKRSQLTDQLLQRPEYVDLWTKKWLDVLRVSRDSIQLAGAKAYQGWLRERIAGDESLAEVAAALLTSTGESFTNPAANFYAVARDPKEITDAFYLQKDLAEATSQLFLGVRLQCAQCHNHPYERWTQNDYLALAACFTQVKRSRLGKAGPAGRPDRRQMAIELNMEAPEITRAGSNERVAPGFFGTLAYENSPKYTTPENLPGEPEALKAEEAPEAEKAPEAEEAPEQSQLDRRQLLANWLTEAENPFFARAIVNRVWFHLNGRGIVDPVDDFRDSNPSANDPLLNSLAEDFAANGYQLRPLIRTIVNSRIYQLDVAVNETNERDVRYFSHRIPSPLTAEVLLDAICDVTAVPEPYEVMQDYIEGIPTESVKFPLGTRAVQLPVNDIATLINTSGKYVRYELHPFLRTFGQPNGTQTCECDRSQAFGRKQALELIVGPMVTAKLSNTDNRIGQLLAEWPSDTEVLDELYLRAFSRPPSAAARESLLNYVAESENKRAAWEDVLWTILNSQEFIFQH